MLIIHKQYQKLENILKIFTIYFKIPKNIVYKLFINKKYIFFIF